jgi:hypothetical protein
MREGKQKLLWTYIATVIFFTYILVDALRDGHGRITQALTIFLGTSGIIFVLVWLLASPILLYFSRRVVPDVEPAEKSTVVTSPLIKINGRRWVEVTEVDLNPSPTKETAQNCPGTHEKNHDTVRHGAVGQKKYGVGDIEKVMSLRRQTDAKGKPTPIRVIAELTGISSSTVGRIVKENS